MDINYLSLDEILAIHFDQVNRYGGSHGVRDFDLLISAITRPKASFGGLDLYSDLYSKAASLIHSLILNHPFVDGNKRTAVVAMARFLFINNISLRITQKELFKLPLNIESKKLNTNEIGIWIKKHSNKI